MTDEANSLSLSTRREPVGGLLLERLEQLGVAVKNMRTSVVLKCTHTVVGSLRLTSMSLKLGSPNGKFLLQLKHKDVRPL